MTVTLTSLSMWISKTLPWLDWTEKLSALPYGSLFLNTEYKVGHQIHQYSLTYIRRVVWLVGTIILNSFYIGFITLHRITISLCQLCNEQSISSKDFKSLPTYHKIFMHGQEKGRYRYYLIMIVKHWLSRDESTRTQWVVGLRGQKSVILCLQVFSKNTISHGTLSGNLRESILSLVIYQRFLLYHYSRVTTPWACNYLQSPADE